MIKITVRDGRLWVSDTLAGAGQRRDAAPEWSAGTRDCCCGGPRENMARVTIYWNVIKINKCQIYLACIP